jgi:hypothetical protein
MSNEMQDYLKDQFEDTIITEFQTLTGLITQDANSAWYWKAYSSFIFNKLWQMERSKTNG